MHIGQGPGEPDSRFQESSPNGVMWKVLNSPAMVNDNVQRVLPQTGKEVHPSFDV